MADPVSDQDQDTGSPDAPDAGSGAPSASESTRIVLPTTDHDGNSVWQSPLSSTTYTTRARALVRPDRVIPVVFLPGIMGTYLCKKAADEGQEKEVVWAPPNGILSSLGAVWTGIWRSAAKRQRELDPDNTEVWDKGEIRLASKARELLAPTAEEATKTAQARGWGSIWADGYSVILNALTSCLNHTGNPPDESPAPAAAQQATAAPEGDKPYADGTNSADARNHHADIWKELIAGEYWDGDALDKQRFAKKIGSHAKEKITWGTKAAFKLDPAWLETMGKAEYPVFVFGYNWLRSNGDSGKELAVRVDAIIQEFVAQKRTCDQVLLVSHSMGGLVVRGALAADDSLAKTVVGVVHGVMPATGAAATYKRIRAGWDGYQESMDATGAKESQLPADLAALAKYPAAVLDKALEIIKLPGAIFPFSDAKKQAGTVFGATPPFTSSTPGREGWGWQQLTDYYNTLNKLKQTGAIGAVTKAAGQVASAVALTKALTTLPGTLAELWDKAVTQNMGDFIGSVGQGAAALVFGRTNKEVTAVLASAQGALELLPCKSYESADGKQGWFSVQNRYGAPDQPLPASDPYEEIYVLDRPWWRLMLPDLLDPGEVIKSKVLKDAEMSGNAPPTEQEMPDAVFKFVQKNIRGAGDFHATINGKYHPNTHIFYGAGTKPHIKSWGGARWEQKAAPKKDPTTDGVGIKHDSGRGQLVLKNGAIYTLAGPDEAGDGTVPARSGAAPTKYVKTAFCFGNWPAAASASGDAGGKSATAVDSPAAGKKPAEATSKAGGAGSTSANKTSPETESKPLEHSAAYQHPWGLAVTLASIAQLLQEAKGLKDC